jgi:hypothetical protein
VKKINTVRVVGVTFNANTHNGNDERVFNYISPYDVSKGDIIIADTMFGPSLAVVKHVTYYDYTERNKWCGLKSIISEALNIKSLKSGACILTQQMINDCARDSEILAEIQRVKKDIATFEKGIEIAKAEYIDSSNECNKLAEKMSNLEIARKFHEGKLYKLKAKAGLL